MQRREFSLLEIAWLAGLLEGEGTFTLIYSRVKGHLYAYAKIGVAMTDRDVIERVASIFGNKMDCIIHERKRKDGSPHLPTYRAAVSGVRARAFMEALLPFMGQRRSERIKAVLRHSEEGANVHETNEKRSRTCKERWIKRHPDYIEKIKQAKRLLEAGVSMESICQETGLRSYTIIKIAKGRSWAEI